MKRSSHHFRPKDLSALSKISERLSKREQRVVSEAEVLRMLIQKEKDHPCL